MPEPSDKRVALSVGLNAEARRVVEDIREDTGVPNTTAMERLLTWFAGMPRKFRVAILTGDEAGRREMLLAWFKETLEAEGAAIEFSKSDDVAARARLAKQLIDEMAIAFAIETKKTGGAKKKG